MRKNYYNHLWYSLRQIDWNEPISNDRISIAIHSLSMLLGNDCADSLIKVLHSRGIILDNETAYSLKEISNILVSLFGEDASSPMMFFLWKQLAKGADE